MKRESFFLEQLQNKDRKLELWTLWLKSNCYFFLLFLFWVWRELFRKLHCWFTHDLITFSHYLRADILESLFPTILLSVWSHSLNTSSGIFWVSPLLVRYTVPTLVSTLSPVVYCDSCIEGSLFPSLPFPGLVITVTEWILLKVCQSLSCFCNLVISQNKSQNTVSGSSHNLSPFSCVLASNSSSFISLIG